MNKRQKKIWKNLTMFEKVLTLGIEILIIFTMFVLPFILCGISYKILGF